MDLSRNRLNGFDDIFVWKLRQIKDVKLESNPLICDRCHMGVLIDIAQTVRYKTHTNTQNDMVIFLCWLAKKKTEKKLVNGKMLKKHEHSVEGIYNNLNRKRKQKKIPWTDHSYFLFVYFNMFSHSSVVVLALLLLLSCYIFGLMLLCQFESVSNCHHCWDLCDSWANRINDKRTTTTTTTTTNAIQLLFLRIRATFYGFDKRMVEKVLSGKNRINVTGEQLALKLQTFDCIYISRELVRFPFFHCCHYPCWQTKTAIEHSSWNLI